MTGSVVHARGVTKAFVTGRQEVWALRGVDLDVADGEFLAIVGPSGSGKTTLLNLLGALDLPTSGELTVLGQAVAEQTRRGRAQLRLHSIGFVFQAYNLVPVLSARENVEFVLELQGRGRGRRQRAMEVLEELGLADLADRRISELSGGQQQRVAVARAVAARPRIVLADEPTANLDGENAEILMHLMRDLCERHGMTFLVSTRDPRVVAHAVRIVTLVDGRVARDELKPGEPPHEILPGAVDLFSPFSPLEPDREWRRGVDAARADVKLSERTSLDVVGAFGERIDASIFAARLRGYRGNADVELVGGRRGRDPFAGLTSSVAVGGAEVHGELVAFRPPRDGSPLLGATVVKALGGASGRIPIGNGLLIFAEYHYSGFGAPTARDTFTYLADPDVAARYARGDMQVMSRHAIAALGSYEQSPTTTWTFEWLQSPVDGSGVVVPSATLTFTDRTSFVVTGYVLYGRARAGAAPGSAFGATPMALFTRLRIYR